MSQDWRDVLDAVREQGWRVETTRNGYALYLPDPEQSPYFLHRTPSDWRAVRNALAELRQRGLDFG